MNYDFDKVIERRGTYSVKWDLTDAIFKGEGLLPLWVADMDFESPREVVEALTNRASHGVYGYTAAPEAYYGAMIQWFKRRHGWEIKPEWILYSPGVVPGLNSIVQAFTKPGDHIVIQQPVYYPFMKAITGNGRVIANSPLILSDNRYSFDFDGLEKTIKEKKARLLILCSPHNPVGRVWSRDELLTLGEICRGNEVTVVSDEVHCDLVYKGGRHVPFASINDDFLMRSITCVSPSKTFNLAGLQTANVVIPNPKLREIYLRHITASATMGPNLFGIEALIAAYRFGDDWLTQVMDYIAGNLEYLKGFIASRGLPLSVIEPEGTYLVWIDFRKLGMDAASLKHFMRNEARVALDDGGMFGAEGEGFKRINIAAPLSVIAEALERIERGIRRTRKVP